MKVRQLYKLLRQQLEAGNGEVDVEVWLPGSTIRLSPMRLMHGKYLIEGNINPGSALAEDDTCKS